MKGWSCQSRFTVLSVWNTKDLVTGHTLIHTATHPFPYSSLRHTLPPTTHFSASLLTCRGSCCSSAWGKGSAKWNSLGHDASKKNYKLLATPSLKIKRNPSLVWQAYNPGYSRRWGRRMANSCLDKGIRALSNHSKGPWIKFSSWAFVWLVLLCSRHGTPR